MDSEGLRDTVSSRKNAKSKATEHLLMIGGAAAVGYLLWRHAQSASAASNQYTAGTSPWPQPNTYTLIQPSGEGNVGTPYQPKPIRGTPTVKPANGGLYAHGYGRGGTLTTGPFQPSARNRVPFAIPAGYGRG